MAAKEFLLAMNMQEQVQEIMVKEETLNKGIAAALNAEDYEGALDLQNELKQLAFGKNGGGEDAMIAGKREKDQERLRKKFQLDLDAAIKDGDYEKAGALKQRMIALAAAGDDASRPPAAGDDAEDIERQEEMDAKSRELEEHIALCVKNEDYMKAAELKDLGWVVLSNR